MYAADVSSRMITVVSFIKSTLEISGEHSVLISHTRKEFSSSESFGIE